jgi:nitroreductase
MNTLDAIYTRRSIRKLSNEKIAPKILEELLKAAMYAPSAYNEQPWQFILIEDANLLKEIPKFHPHSAMALDAFVGILIAGDLRLQKSDGLWPQGCAAATQNLLLAAHEKGLGAVWTGVFPNQERMAGFQKLCALPKEIIPFSFVPIGHPRETPPLQNRFLKERIRHNKW